jgi:hypothetical protein
MNKTTKEMYESHGFSKLEIEKIDKRVKKLPNLLSLESEEDKNFGCAMQKLVARQDTDEAKAVIREQIAAL